MRRHFSTADRCAASPSPDRPCFSVETRKYATYRAIKSHPVKNIRWYVFDGPGNGANGQREVEDRQPETAIEPRTYVRIANVR